jgi:hypothetical protein
MKTDEKDAIIRDLEVEVASLQHVEKVYIGNLDFYQEQVHVQDTLIRDLVRELLQAKYLLKPQIDSPKARGIVAVLDRARDAGFAP